MNTEYFSITKYILQNKTLIQQNEKNFDYIKRTIDFLASLIGFDDMEDIVENDENVPLELAMKVT